MEKYPGPLEKNNVKVCYSFKKASLAVDSIGYLVIISFVVTHVSAAKGIRVYS